MATQIKATDKIILNNGYAMPVLGYGTWRTPDDATAVQAVKDAVSSGYRLIDCAAYYHNEPSIGAGLEALSVARDELFVTSKVWNTERGYAKTKAAFYQTLKDLKLDYLDLYLIHWPASAHQFSNWEEINLSTWQAMTELYEAGLIKAIGVSNFKPHHLKALLETKVPPMVNQIEIHPGLNQAETVAFCQEHGIVVEAWRPLGAGKFLTHETLTTIATKYHKSTAQVCLRWILQQGLVPIPKSVTPSRILENIQVFDFELSAQDMTTISAMTYCGGSGQDPDEIDF